MHYKLHTFLLILKNRSFYRKCIDTIGSFRILLTTALRSGLFLTKLGRSINIVLDDSFRYIKNNI
jgi:hypothetical protein